MRLTKRALSEIDTKKLLTTAEYGILSLCYGDTPYAVPMNYVYIEKENCIYLHCATEGKKLNIITKNPHASFIAVGVAEVHGQKYTTKYTSAIADGFVEIVTGGLEWRRALTVLSDRYYPNVDHNEVIDKYAKQVLVLKFNIIALNGKFNNG